MLRSMSRSVEHTELNVSDTENVIVLEDSVLDALIRLGIGLDPFVAPIVSPFSREIHRGVDTARELASA